MAFCFETNELLQVVGGEGGIRTHGSIATTPDFESGTFDHSATSPGVGREHKQASIAGPKEVVLVWRSGSGARAGATAQAE